MLPYYITIALTFFFASLAHSSRLTDIRRGHDMFFISRNTRTMLVLAVLPLIFTAGFRYNVGTDFMAYYKVDMVFSGDFWSALWTLDEPGLLLLRDTVQFFSDQGAAYIFVFSLFTVGLSCFALLRSTDDYVFTLLLYIFCGSWHGSFNGVRQYLAATVILWGIHNIQERKFLKYALIVFIAFLFHKSAIVMIVVYFVMRNKIKLRNILLLVAGTLIILANYDTLFQFISDLKKETVVMDSYAMAAVNSLRIAVHAAPAVAALVINYNRKLNKNETFCINGLIINACAMIAASNSTYLARIGCYTNLFIPLCLTNVIHLRDKSMEKLMRIGIVVLFAIFWYVEISISPALKNFAWTFFYEDIF